MWPSEERRAPRPGIATDPVHRALADWIRAEIAEVHAGHGGFRVLDVGCGVKPYYPFFQPYATEYVGLDVDNPAAELRGPAEAIPAEDASFDMVLCTQVLEHCADPALAVSEFRRVLRPGGRLLLSTHGVMVYHPAPHDLWRWTHEGLERLFLTNGSWSSVTVRPSIGTTSTLALLLSIYVDLGCRRAHVAPLGRLVIRLLHDAAAAIDARTPMLSGVGPGTLHANYHVTAIA